MDAGLLNLLFLGLLFVVFYMLLIRPQKRRVEQHRQLLESVANGDEIVTIGGFHGRVERIGDDYVELEIAPGTVIKLVKSAIARKVSHDEEIEPAGADSDEVEERGEERA